MLGSTRILLGRVRAVEAKVVKAALSQTQARDLKIIPAAAVTPALVPISVVDVADTTVWVMMAGIAASVLGFSRWFQPWRPLSDQGIAAQMTARYKVIGRPPIMVE
eukprot:RCo036968